MDLSLIAHADDRSRQCGLLGAVFVDAVCYSQHSFCRFSLHAIRPLPLDIHFCSVECLYALKHDTYYSLSLQ
jgi:hypothetical protein